MPRRHARDAHITERNLPSNNLAAPGPVELATPIPFGDLRPQSFGTAMTFFQPKCFISAGTVSFLYFSCNRLPRGRKPGIFHPNLFEWRGVIASTAKSLILVG